VNQTLAEKENILRFNAEISSAVECYVSSFLETSVAKYFVYHDLQHTRDVVSVCKKLGEAYKLNATDLTNLLLAAWFHDTGFVNGSENHENRSVEIALSFLNNFALPPESLSVITRCIQATCVPHTPHTLLEKIICDADLSHLGTDAYWYRNARVREEMVNVSGKSMTEEEWLDFEIAFMLSHNYQTDIARAAFDASKSKHIKILYRQKERITAGNYAPEINFTDKFSKNSATSHSLNGKEDAIEKAMHVGKGAETMFRTTYDTHNNLSALADHKANQMLTVNTLMIVISLCLLLPQLENAPQFIIPTMLMLTVCLTCIVLATMATRPKVTTGEVTLENIRQKRSNLLFFGNFHNMKLDDFQWGMMEMIKDADFQYSSMTRDLYFLGKVLAAKYHFLTLCYNVFMYGIIISVLLFSFAFISGASMATKLPVFLKH